MGHTEMLLAVAGLDELGLKDRVEKLAGGDWSSFRPDERAGLLFARKLTRTPWEVGQSDIETLVAHLGRERLWPVHRNRHRRQYRRLVALRRGDGAVAQPLLHHPAP